MGCKIKSLGRKTFHVSFYENQEQDFIFFPQPFSMCMNLITVWKFQFCFLHSPRDSPYVLNPRKLYIVTKLHLARFFFQRKPLRLYLKRSHITQQDMLSKSGKQRYVILYARIALTLKVVSLSQTHNTCILSIMGH